MREFDEQLRAHQPDHGNVPEVLQAGTRLLKAASDARECKRLYGHLTEKLSAAGLYPHKHHLNTVIGACTSEGDAQGAKTLLRESQRRTPPVRTDASIFSLVIGSLAEMGDWAGIDEARALMEVQDPPISRDRHLYATLMCADAKQGKGEEVERLLEEMRLRSRVDPDLRPDCRDWSYAITAYLRRAADDRGGGRDDAAPLDCLRLLLRMQVQDPPLEPTARNYGTALWSCAYTGDWKTAQEMRRLMLAQQSPVILERSGWVAFLQAHALGGNPDGARAALESMWESERDIDPDIDNYAIVITSYQRAGRLPEAMDLVDDAIMRGVFAPTAGYDPDGDALDFHRAAIAGRNQPDPGQGGLSVEATLILLEWQRERGEHLMERGNHLTPASTLIVGKGNGLLRNAILARLEEWGWPYRVAPDNEGRLIPVSPTRR